ncbi:MAG TPA: helix-turn-helix transcriptional regulator [Rhizomicrobium sp.]|jgi:putative transcriptional regulator
MAIVVHLDRMLARRRMHGKELAERIGITEANLSLLRSGKVKGVRFSTLEKICAELACQPGDLLEFRHEGLQTAQLAAS